MPIKTFLEACKKLKVDPKKVVPSLTGVPKKNQTAMIAYAKLLVIAEALNDGWIPDWDNSSEYKYWPWFWMDKPGFRFFASYYSRAASHSTGGSRLCFRTRELSDYAGKKFLSLWKDMMVIPKPAKKKK